MPNPCDAEGLYPEGDPMSDSSALRLYLTDTEIRWATLTPFDGVEPLQE